MTDVEDILKKYKTPHRLHMETTNYCNLRCEHCYKSASSYNSHYPIDVLEIVLAEAKRSGVSKITLTGGELFTHPDWKNIVRKSLTTCDNIYILSNGLLLDNKKLQWLANKKVLATIKNIFSKLKWTPVEIGLGISLDGLVGNSLVRKDMQGNSVDAVSILKKIDLATRYGLAVTVNTTITNSTTAKELPQMYDILSQKKIDRWQIDVAFLAGRMKEGEFRDGGLMWLNDAKESFVEILKKYLNNYPRKLPKWRLEIVQVFRYDSLFGGFHPVTSLKEHPCQYNLGSIIVEDGDSLRFCPSLRTVEMGGMNKYGDFISTINASKEFKQFLHGTIENLPCKNCRYVKIFHGGCRANSYSYRGKIWDIDPICCVLAPFVEDKVVPLLPKDLQKEFLAAIQLGPRGMLED